MESIIISKKALAREIFFAFSAELAYNDWCAAPSKNDHSFIWTFKQGHEVAVEWHVSRDLIAFRADPSDMVSLLQNEWQKAIAYFEENERKLMQAK